MRHDWAQSFADDGPRRYARWDPAVFQALIDGPAQRLQSALEGQPESENVLKGYLRLAEEAVGLGYFDQTHLELIEPSSATTPFDTLLSLLWWSLIPNTLPEVPSPERLPMLVRLWNLAEGLFNEPRWLDRYVTSAAEQFTDLKDVEPTLESLLEPALQTPEPASWTGPFTTHTLDLRPVQTDFLPGDLFLVAPSVIAVRDRRHLAHHIAVFLRRGGKSRTSSVIRNLEPYQTPPSSPTLALMAEAVRIDAHRVPLPRLAVPYRQLITPSGFAIITAVDSQWLWVVESP